MSISKVKLNQALRECELHTKRLNIIKDYDKWLELRIVRNELSHEYEDDPVQNSTEINKVFELKNSLISYVDDVVNYFKTKNR